MIKRVCIFVVTVLTLAGCALDEEDALRRHLAGWLHLGATDHFTSTSSCTVGVFQVAKMELRDGAPLDVFDYGDAVKRIAAGQAVHFLMPDHSPNRVSEEVMSRDLGRGLGLLSAGVGPMMDCMAQDHIRRGVYLILTSDQAGTIYDPGRDALILLYPPEKLAVYLRGNV